MVGETQGQDRGELEQGTYINTYSIVIHSRLLCRLIDDIILCRSVTRVVGCTLSLSPLGINNK